MSDNYDKTLRYDLIDAFANAVQDLAPHGSIEAVEAAGDCLINALIAYLAHSTGKAVPSDIVRDLVDRVQYAINAARAASDWQRLLDDGSVP